MSPTYLEHMQQPANCILIVDTTNGNVDFDLSLVEQFPDPAACPNLFFLFLLHWNWTQGEFDAIDLGMQAENDVLTERDQTILRAFRELIPPARYQHTPLHLHISSCFVAAHNAQMANMDATLGQYALACIMRSANNLLKHFDVPSVNVQANAVLEPHADNHHSFIDCMVVAATAHFIYRSKIKVSAHQAAQVHFGKGDLQTLTRKECHRNSSLTVTCLTTFFREQVLNLEKRMTDNAVQNAASCAGFSQSQFCNNTIIPNLALTAEDYLLRGYQPLSFTMDFNNPGNNQIVQAGNLFTSAGRRYCKTTYEEFMREMATGSASVKRTHNIVMQTSMSGGANISHFPNYHLDQCEEMCDADQVRSASSQDEVTWIVQALAGLTPLSNKACRKMMGIQEQVQNSVVQQSAEFFGATNSLNHPTLSGVFEMIAEDRNNFSGHKSHVQNEGTPWAANEYRTNLMLSVMAHFNPSAQV